MYRLRNKNFSGHGVPTAYFMDKTKLKSKFERILGKKIGNDLMDIPYFSLFNQGI